MSRRSWFDDQVSLSHTEAQSSPSCGNVYRLIARREICPRTKRFPKKQRGGGPNQDCKSLFRLKDEAKRDARSGLCSWVEAESLRHLSAKYCPLEPLPKSTIAVAFRLDGRRLASTHGDHTVKIIDSETGTCLKVLSGHQRTPWVVRFHPDHHDILASGSLDHEVRVWDANTSECIASRHFYRPIASIAFHASGEFLAVASGHKLYLWQYKGTGESSSPIILLKTRRSLRAVNFHPHGAPFLLTAEVNDLDSSDPPISRATSFGGLHYSAPRLHMTNVHLVDHLRVSAELPLMPLHTPYTSSSARDDISGGLCVSNEQNFPNQSLAKSSTSTQIHIDASSTQHNDHRLSPVEMHPITSITHSGMKDKLNIAEGEQNPICGNTEDVTDPTAMQEIEECHQTSTSKMDIPYPNIRPLPSISHTFELPGPVTNQQGWSVGQGQAGINPSLPLSNHMYDHSQGDFGVHYTPFISNSFIGNRGIPGVSTAIPPTINRSLVLSASGVQQQLGNVLTLENGIPNTLQRVDFVPMFGVIPSELSVPFASASGTELPCTVKLRIWSYDAKNPCELLDDDKCHLTISHAVLCSEMGAHVSPCGKYLAACVACVLPKVEAEPGLAVQLNQDVGGAGSSPTRHPTLAHEVLYELRIYSLEKSTFGSVLVSRAVRAAHCLTSIQFSPTSEHILLAYGRRHSSLLKSILINGEVSVPVYTVLEVYRVSDLELVSVLPSAEDEVNVACFHPLAGGGLVYGTKEGKLRILQYDGVYKVNHGRSNSFPGLNVVEVQTYALEC